MNTYTLKITGEAVEDLEDIFQWYEKQADGLGSRFLQFFGDGLEKISQTRFLKLTQDSFILEGTS